MFDEYFKSPPSVVSLTIFAATLPILDTAGASSSTTIDQDAPSPSTSPNNETTITPINFLNVEQPFNEEDTKFDSDTFTNPFAPPEICSAKSSSRIINTSNMHSFQQPPINTKRWTKDHTLVTIIDDPLKPVSTRQQLSSLVAKAYVAHKNMIVYQMDVKTAFLNEILKEDVYYGFEQCDVVDIPMMERSKLDKDPNGTPVDGTRYRGMVGSLIYLIASRPDLVFVVCMCARYQAKPTEKHQTAVFKTQGKLTDYGFDYNQIPLYCDSKSAIALSCNTVQPSQTKHIAIRYHFIKEQVENEVFELSFIKTAYQLANIFTKALAR
ncbi:hypothetical protein Tco_0005736 [Tanacetum coccineum]